MCVMATMLVTTVLTTAAGLMAQQEAAANSRRLANYQASVAEQQARAAQYEAENARKMAKYDAASLRREFLRAQGTQRSLLAAGGVSMGDGSAMDVLLDNAAQAGRERELRLYQGEMQAWRHERQADSLLGDAGASRIQAASSRVSGWTYVSAVSGAAGRAAGIIGGS